MPDYQQGKIYTIRCRTDNTSIYVGSTTQSLAKRWGGHKVDSKRCNVILYQVINGEWKNWYIELYELYPCNNKEELCKKEGEITRLIGNLNSRIAGRTQKEYNEIYYENNKEKLAVKNKTNYDEKYKEKITCECGCVINRGYISRHIKSQKHIDLLNNNIYYN